LLPIIPRKAGARRDCRRGSNGAAGELRLWAGRAAGPGFLREFGNLRKRLPGCHPFAPAQVRAGEFSAAQSFAHFIVRKCTEIRAAPVDMKSSHSVGFYVVAALVSSAEVRLRRALKVLKGLQRYKGRPF
jgi:hypothetical protein